jgi:hypothetical protein
MTIFSERTITIAYTWVTLATTAGHYVMASTAGDQGNHTRSTWQSHHVTMASRQITLATTPGYQLP